jgi:glycosyltransferase involved in cell wall biosynthesis
MHKTYGPLFTRICVDGYFCWNKNFEDYAHRNSNYFTHFPSEIRSIQSRYASVDVYRPSQEKEKWIVFASRMDSQKNPHWIIDAINIMKDKIPTLLNGWRFKICGDGPLRNSVIEIAQRTGSSHLIDFLIVPEMHRILNHSMIYVSTQDYENFPSLSMAEAMASGNAIVARDVGQTALFVKDRYNGILIHPDTPEGLASGLMELMADDAAVARMGSASRYLIDNTHNYSNFVLQIESFWHSLFDGRKRFRVV